MVKFAYGCVSLQALLPIVLRQGGAKVPHVARPWLALSFSTCLALNTAAYEVSQFDFLIYYLDAASTLASTIY